MRYPKKITTAAIGLDTRTNEDIAAGAKGKPVEVARVYGRLHSSKQEISTLNDMPYNRYSGEFEAHNLVTDEKFRSGQLIVPPVAEAILDTYMSTAKKEDENAAADFIIGISVLEHKSDRGGVKFRYEASPLLTSDEPDSIAELGSKVKAPKLLTSKKK